MDCGNIFQLNALGWPEQLILIRYVELSDCKVPKGGHTETPIG